MKEFDNVRTEDLYILLNESTTLARFYPLIPMKQQLIQQLLSIGITDKYEFFKASHLSVPNLAHTIGFEESVIRCLENFFHQTDFMNRRLKELKSFENQEFLDLLAANHIKYSKDYLFLCLTHKADELAVQYKTIPESIIKLFYLCDLMRLPGVKDIRASLYYNSGYIGIKAFTEQSVETMQTTIAAYLNQTKEKKIIPLKKELSTQIAVAKVLPLLVPAQ